MDESQNKWNQLSLPQKFDIIQFTLMAMSIFLLALSVFIGLGIGSLLKSYTCS